MSGLGSGERASYESIPREDMTEGDSAHGQDNEEAGMLRTVDSHDSLAGERVHRGADTSPNTPGADDGGGEGEGSYQAAGKLPSTDTDTPANHTGNTSASDAASPPHGHILRAESPSVRIHRQISEMVQERSSVWFYLFTLLLLLAIGTGFYKMHQDTVQLNTQLLAVTSRLEAYQKRVHEKFGNLNHDMVADQSNSTHTVEYLQMDITAQNDQLSAMSQTLHRLADRTTNADVLEQLNKTRSELRTEMQTATASVSSTIHDNRAFLAKTLTANQDSVSSAIDASNDKLEQQLEANKQSVAVAKKDVYTRMDTTVSKINVMVAAAQQGVSSMQHNVTENIHHWNRVLDSTVMRLNDDIKTAEAKIHNDVSLLQSNVDTYVEVTNKQVRDIVTFTCHQPPHTLPHTHARVALPTGTDPSYPWP